MAQEVVDALDPPPVITLNSRIIVNISDEEMQEIITQLQEIATQWRHTPRQLESPE